MKDYSGTEIKVGSRVRHAYEPWPGNKSGEPGLGYHYHYFAGTAEVVEIVGENCVRVHSAVRMIPVFLGCLLEVVPNAGHATTVPYLNELPERWKPRAAA